MWKSLRSLERYRVADWKKNSISPLSPRIILYIIGLESMKLRNQKKIVASNHEKDMNEME